MGFNDFLKVVNSGAIRAMFLMVHTIASQKRIHSSEYADAYWKLAREQGKMSEEQKKEFANLRQP